MPIPVISNAQMRQWEQATWAAGHSETEVIRRVGRAVADHASRLTRPRDFVLVLAGCGHNGADARNTLEHFDDRRVDILEVRDPVADLPELKTLLAIRPDLVIDGLFGIGINRPLDAGWCRFIEELNRAQLQVLSIDVPSGLNSDTGEAQPLAVQATVTLTVGAPKRGLLAQQAWPFVGRLDVAHEIGLAPCDQESKLQWSLPCDFAGFPPRRPAGSHKGSFGHLALLAGSVGYHGAAVLAARGAQRARPGLITLFTHPSAYQPAAAQLQSVMVQSWSGEVQMPGGFSAILAGPGLASAEAEQMRPLVSDLWLNAPVPMIADASGMAWLPSKTHPEALRVITPHPGEAARLLQTTAADIQADRPAAVRRLSEKFHHCWVVLKGHQTLIGRSSGAIAVNSSGNPGLAQGGSGDVLSGYLAGLLSQPQLQSDPGRTLRYGVWQHGAAADALEFSRPNWIVEDLVIQLGGN